MITIWEKAEEEVGGSNNNTIRRKSLLKCKEFKPLLIRVETRKDFATLLLIRIEMRKLCKIMATKTDTSKLGMNKSRLHIRI